MFDFSKTMLTAAAGLAVTVNQLNATKTSTQFHFTESPSAIPVPPSTTPVAPTSAIICGSVAVVVILIALIVTGYYYYKRHQSTWSGIVETPGRIKEKA
jgi:hypothetical protein